jgi:Flp pilus assembly protein TadD
LFARVGRALARSAAALVEDGHVGEAEATLREALALAPDEPEVTYRLGALVAYTGRPEEGEGILREALRRSPTSPELLLELAGLCVAAGRVGEAVRRTEDAVWANPTSPLAHYGRACLSLWRGDLEAGWAAARWRYLLFGGRRPPAGPAWDGAPAGGKTILLWWPPEEALGDCLQFCRFGPLVRARGGPVVMEAPRPLLPLLSTLAGVDRLVAAGDALPPYDLQAPLMDAPWRLGTSLATLPAALPYLAPQPARVDAWRRRLGADGTFRVGIAWRGILR